MGYLFDINREITKIFIRATVNKNNYLNSIDYINDFLNEDKKVKRMILQVYADHNADLKARIERGVSRATFIPSKLIPVDTRNFSYLRRPSG